MLHDSKKPCHQDRAFDPKRKDSPAHQQKDTRASRFLISSPNRFQMELLKTSLEEEFSVPVDCYERMPLQSVIDRQPIDSSGPCLYMLDCYGLTTSMIQSNLDIRQQHLAERFFITLFNVTDDTGLSPLVKRYQVRGIFYRNDSFTIFIKGIRMVLDSYLWLTRKMFSACIRYSDENKRQPSAFKNAMAILSGREIEVLQHVAFGGSNQEIADALHISMHTVKAHLYKIYKKINVPNRLQAAMWASTHLETKSES